MTACVRIAASLVMTTMGVMQTVTLFTDVHRNRFAEGGNEDLQGYNHPTALWAGIEDEVR